MDEDTDLALLISALLVLMNRLSVGGT